MGCCNDSTKNNCGSKVYATCVYYEGNLPEYSKLDKDCVVAEETIEELYKNQELILKSIDTSEIQEDCIDYPRTDDNKILVVDILQKLQDEICSIKEKPDTSSNNIDLSNLDMKCLEDEPCYNSNSLNNVLQTMIDKICELNSRIEQLENTQNGKNL